MEETVVYIDGGFLSKLSNHLGKGKYIRIDYIKFSKLISKKLNLFCKHIFYYTAPPFQATPPTDDQKRRKEGYDKFKSKISKIKELTFREGRVQKLKDDKGNDYYKQKGVDTLVVMDLMNMPRDYIGVKKVILIACDSDFVPVIDYLKNLGIEVILATYFINERNTNFSRSNELMQSVSNHIFINRGDFDRSAT